jgi:hypothetical protein
VKSPSINKVFVVGAQLELILVRTEKQKIKNDAFTNDAIRMIEDEESDVANRLSIIKICTRHQSQMIDKSLLQSTGYASLWFVAVTEEENNTESFCHNHADKLIAFLNSCTKDQAKQYLANHW